MKQLFVIMCLLVPFSTLAQREIKGFPSDLDRSKIIFLEYEKLAVGPEVHKIIRKDYTKRNEIFEENNKMLANEAPNYPFEYIISKRSEYRELVAQGYKYVLENDLIAAYNNGLQTYPGGGTQYISTMYLIDIVSGDKYELFTITDKSLRHYDWVISKFNDKVIKEYKKK